MIGTIYSILSNYPPEFRNYIPFFNDDEINYLKIKQTVIEPSSSLIELKNVLIDYFNENKKPSSMFFYALGKVLFIISDYDTIEELLAEYNDLGIKLWEIKVKLRRGYNGDVIQESLAILENKDLPVSYRLNVLTSICAAYSNTGVTSQYKHYLEEIFYEAMNIHKYSTEEKMIVNDNILIGHIVNIWAEKLNYPLMKLENMLNVALHIAEELEDRYYLGLLYNIQGVLYYYVGQLDKAIANGEKAQKYLETIGAKRALASVKGNLASVSILRNEIERAEEYLRSSLKIFVEVKDHRNQALVYCSLGDISIAQGDLEDGLLKYEEALALLEQYNLKEWQVYCSVGELYFYTNQFDKMKFVINIIENAFQCPNGVVGSYLKFFYGLLALKDFNYGQAVNYFKESLSISDIRGKGVLSAKILSYLTIVNLKQYDTTNELRYLREADFYINEIIPFFKETRKLEEVAILLAINAKIYVSLGDLTSAFNSLQLAKDILLDLNRKKIKRYHLFKEITDKIDKLEIAFSTGKPDDVYDIWNFNEESKQLEMLVIKQRMGLEEKEEEVARTDVLALLIVHPSGIPMLTYTSKKSNQFRDELMFGGFIMAVKDMIEELFKEPEQSRVMVISYGNNKIIMENSLDKKFSVIILSAKDSFIHRRKLHTLVNEMKDIPIPKQYIVKLKKEIIEEINNKVHSVFGDNMVLYEGV